MGAMHSDGKLTITEDIMTDLVYTKISWVRDQDIQISGKQVILYFIYVFIRCELWGGEVQFFGT